MRLTRLFWKRALWAAIPMAAKLRFKLNKNWSTGFLFDYAPVVDNPSQRTLSYSPYVTWNISEFNRLRFQYSLLEQ